MNGLGLKRARTFLGSWVSQQTRVPLDRRWLNCSGRMMELRKMRTYLHVPRACRSGQCKTNAVDSVVFEHAVRTVEGWQNYHTPSPHRRIRHERRPDNPRRLSRVRCCPDEATVGLLEVTQANVSTYRKQWNFRKPPQKFIPAELLLSSVDKAVIQYQSD